MVPLLPGALLVGQLLVSDALRDPSATRPRLRVRRRAPPPPLLAGPLAMRGRSVRRWVGDLIEFSQGASCVRQPELLVLVGIAEHRVRHHVAVQSVPGNALLHAAEGDRLRLSAIRLKLGKSGLLAVGKLYRLARMHAVGHDDIPGSPTG
eukprot:scaffold105585_cov72-Phaeocystis_antarctica.AAC.3